LPRGERTHKKRDPDDGDRRLGSSTDYDRSQFFRIR
jgi:hypothetical protein